MAAKSTLKNMVLCLTAVCLGCSAVLGAVNAFTLDPIAAAQQAKTRESIAKVLPEFSGELKEGSIEVDGVQYPYYLAEGVGCAVTSTVSGFGGPLSVMVGITSDGTVHNTVVLSHSETPGLGAKCQTDETFLSQFRGWNPAEKKLLVRKDGGDVDAITASTITSRAYTLAISNALKAAEKIAAQNTTGGQNNE